MAIFNRWSLTRNGMKLITKAQAGKCSIHFTKLETGDGEWSSTEDLQYATALKSLKQSFTFSSIDIPDGNPSTVVLEAVINNLKLTKLYYLMEMGVYADDPDDGEILYAVAAADSASTYLPANNGIGISTITERINIEVANAEDVTIDTTGAVVAASDFLSIKAKVEKISDSIAGGTTGQYLTKKSGTDCDFIWKDFNPVVVGNRADFPAVGEENAAYIDTSTSSIYVWDTKKKAYSKLPLGAEASETLQAQITANRKSIEASDEEIADLKETVYSETFVTISKDKWTESTESGTKVYTYTAAVKGLTEDTKMTVWPHVISTAAADIITEQKALGVMFSRGRSFADKDSLILKCYGRKPTASFGLRLQGMEA